MQLEWQEHQCGAKAQDTLGCVSGIPDTQVPCPGWERQEDLPYPVYKESLKSAKPERDMAHKNYSGSWVEAKFEGNGALSLGVWCNKRHLMFWPRLKIITFICTEHPNSLQGVLSLLAVSLVRKQVDVKMNKAKLSCFPLFWTNNYS